jgi:hypothetical protein
MYQQINNDCGLVFLCFEVKTYRDVQVVEITVPSLQIMICSCFLIQILFGVGYIGFV